MTESQRKAMQDAIDYIRSTADYKMGSPPACETVCDLHEALAEPAVEPERVHRIVYPGGGKLLFQKLWGLTCNAVATQAGMRVRTDVLPMLEMRAFIEQLCVLVDSPPLHAAPVREPAPVPVASQFDIKTSAGGRGFVGWYFTSVLQRHAFADYIRTTLAADFACALAKGLSASPQPAPLPLLTDDEVLAAMHRALPSMSYASEAAFMNGVRVGESLARQKAGL